MDEVLLALTDVPRISAIEDHAYAFPWSPGHFRDSLAAGHLLPGFEIEGRLVAYAVLMPVLDETHLLNITVARDEQGKGIGREMLLLAMRLAATVLDARSMLLEVRISHAKAQALYESLGFQTIGIRKDYYPLGRGREDARVMRRALP
jgi:ribosomal-protein-alanine N-acetyltransferase